MVVEKKKKKEKKIRGNVKKEDRHTGQGRRIRIGSLE